MSNKVFFKLLGLSILFLVTVAASRGCQLVPITIVEYVTVDEAYTLIQDNIGNDDFIIIDVRTAAEYNTGHIEDAILIDYYSGTFAQQLDALDKSKTYLIYCRTGNRSAQTGNIMNDLGFVKVYNMLGGINDWVDKGYPIVI